MSTYGIDLGTTYSCIARLDQNGNPEVVRNNEDNSNTLASVVFFENENNVIVGQAAKENIETDGDRVVQFVKREIGKAASRTYTFDGKTYTPVEISALILTRLKNIVESQGGTIDNVVITVPAYFGLEERSATKQAGELAGLNVLSLINEPTAAALSYCARQFQEDRTILVYDLGGGTFDVTVVKMSMTPNDQGGDVQKITVLATGGDDRLGGKDWDDKLFNYILSACCDENGLTQDDIEAETRQDIRSKVEEAKRKLSQKESTKVRIDVNGSRTEVVVTRKDFERLTADKVAQTMNFVDSTLAKVPDAVIDTVLLVGGSTYMPMIKNAVEEKFPGKVQQHDPDQAVAKGAAIYASMLGLAVEGVDLLRLPISKRPPMINAPNSPPNSPSKTKHRALSVPALSTPRAPKINISSKILSRSAKKCPPSQPKLIIPSKTIRNASDFAPLKICRPTMPLSPASTKKAIRRAPTPRMASNSSAN